MIVDLYSLLYLTNTAKTRLYIDLNASGIGENEQVLYIQKKIKIITVEEILNESVLLVTATVL